MRAETVFINPYNFIPVSGEKKQFDQEAYGKGRKYSGVIEYSLLTKTPLFIPNTSNDDAFRIRLIGEQEDSDTHSHKSYDFYSYTDLSERTTSVREDPQIPVIPGSEIRGMLRSYYEILTNSCLSQVDDPTLSKRTAEVFKAGLIERTREGKYLLHEGEDCIFRTTDDSLVADFSSKSKFYKAYRTKLLKEGQKVWINKGDNEKGKIHVEEIFESPEGTHIEDYGYVIKGEDGPVMGNDKEKHCLHIVCPKTKNWTVSRAVLSTMTGALKAYKDNNDKSYSEYRKAWEQFLGSDVPGYFPVYYSILSGGKTRQEEIMLAPASITREVYQTTVPDILKNMKHEACTDRDSLCPACALFGTVNGNLKVTSRLRFSDLKLAESFSRIKTADLYEPKPVTMKALSSPKVSNIEFYLKRPDNAWFWTYDYYVDKTRKVRLCDAKINGRKFYWHQPDMDLSDITEEGSALNTTARVLKEGICFSGKLFFRSLTAEELNEIIYLLNGADEKNASLEGKEHGYKLGHGKPLGLGSIALNVDKVSILSYDLDTQHKCIVRTEEEYQEYRTPAIDPEILKNFEVVTDFNVLKGKKGIEYPHKKFVKGEDTIFNWFVNNHVSYREDRKTGRGEYQANGMGNKRNGMGIASYMEALTPELQATGIIRSEIESCQHAGNISGKQQGSGFPKRADSKGIRFEIGKKYTGKIEGYIPAGGGMVRKLKVNLTPGGRFTRADVQLKKLRIRNAEKRLDAEYKTGNSIVLVYRGKGGEYDIWEEDGYIPSH